ncbi:MAG: histidinol-phosphate transaminase [Methanopyraceae archaeon]
MRVRRHVLELEPYTPGKSKEELAREYGVEPEEIVKLGSNENPLGPSPKAVEAAKRELERLHEYPEAVAPPELFDAIREYLADPPYPAGEPVDVSEDHLIVGGDGADEIIDLLVRVTVDPGDAVLTLAPTFSQYGISTRAAGGEVRHAPLDPERDFRPDEDALFEALDGVRIAFLCTPNNPTGNALPERLVRDVIEECPGVVLIDHAYVEFADHDYTPLALEYDNVLVLRTCSKALGLAGARVGYAVADPEIIEHLHRVKPVFSLTRPSAAAAKAALRDREHVRKTVKLVREERDRLLRRINGLPGLRAYPSEANFLFVDVGPAGTDAPTLTEELLKRGVIIRDCSSFEGVDEPRYVRVSVGLPEENDRFLETAREVLESLESS